MRKGGGKSKGGSFERKICLLLSRWITNGKSDDVFWRSALSGGRSTVAAKKGVKLSRVAGDICATSPEGFVFCDWFYSECKHYKQLDFETFLLTQRGTLAKFWRTATREAAAHGRAPMLIVKQNHSPIYIVAMKYDIDRFFTGRQVPTPIVLKITDRNKMLAIYEFNTVLQFKPPKAKRETILPEVDAAE